MFRARLRERVFERFGVVIPELAFLVVVVADFPIASWIVETLFETLQLLFLADVQEELDDVGVVLPV